MVTSAFLDLYNFILTKFRNNLFKLSHFKASVFRVWLYTSISSIVNLWVCERKNHIKFTLSAPLSLPPDTKDTDAEIQQQRPGRYHNITIIFSALRYSIPPEHHNYKLQTIPRPPWIVLVWGPLLALGAANSLLFACFTSTYSPGFHGNPVAAPFKTSHHWQPIVILHTNHIYWLIFLEESLTIFALFYLVYLDIVKLIKYRCRYFLIVVTRFPESRTNSRFLSAFNQDSVEGSNTNNNFVGRGLDKAHYSKWIKRTLYLEQNL